MSIENRRFLVLAMLFVMAIVVTSFSHMGPSSESGLVGPSVSVPVGLVTLDGTIRMSEPSAFIQPSGAESIIQQLRTFEKDKKIKALLLRINSPGGTVGATQEVYNAIFRVKATLDIPVVASIGDVGASGAYWIALAADHIIANPGSMIGSIGVIMANFDLSEISKKHGISMNTIKSGKYKDSMSSWREMTDEEHVLLQGMVDNVHQQFLTVFQERRNLDDAQARFLADGQIFSGQQAQEQQLIDETGGLYEAIHYLKQQLKTDKELQFIRKRRDPVDNFFSMWTSSFSRNALSSLTSPTLR